MTDKKILICGDSFAAKHTDADTGWPSLLEQYYNVENRAQFGVSEYKIWQQVKHAPLCEYDVIVVCHTSPNRVHIRKHPVHRDTVHHKNCDLIYSDVEHRGDPVSKIAVDYFKNIFDEEYYNDIYLLMKQEIDRLCTNTKCINISFFNGIPDVTNYFETFQKHRGSVNHLTNVGNQIVASAMHDKIGKMFDK
jgi:hypothetical protein